MKFTIIKPDNRVRLGNFSTDVIDLSALPSTLHAVQWNGTNGHIEMEDGINEPIVDISEYQDILDQIVVIKAEYDARAADEFYGMTLAEKQSVIKDRIKDTEDRKNTRKFTHNDGHTYRVNGKLEKILIRCTGLNDPSPIPVNNGKLEDIDDVKVSMTVGGFKELIAAIDAREAANIETRRNHIAAMKSLTDPAVYDYSKGWA
jgi:hypothetical protein